MAEILFIVSLASFILTLFILFGPLWSRIKLQVKGWYKGRNQIVKERSKN